MRGSRSEIGKNRDKISQINDQLGRKTEKRGVPWLQQSDQHYHLLRPTSIGDKNDELKGAAIHYNSSSSKFTDMKPNAFYLDAVAWAVGTGVTTGTTATTFNPSGICNRGQIVTFLYRAYK